MATTWSTYQNDVFNFVTEGKGSAVISAVAGSGKTTTIVECAKRIPRNKSVLFLAFNKSIAEELSQRLSAFPNVQCMTLHSLGYRAIMKTCRGRRLFMHYTKQRDYILNNIEVLSNVISNDTPDAEKNIFTYNTCNLLEKCRVNLINANEKEKIEEIAAHHSIDLFADEVNAVSLLLETCYTFNVGDKIDFTDMLTLPIKNASIKRYVPKYDWVFIDECQDLSRAQRELMLSALKDDGRFIAVGDRNQAINGFAGAGCDSFDLLADLANKNELPLSVNYRCGKDIIALAQQIVPQIKAFEGSECGKVINTKSFADLKGGDMVLCRTAAPLVSLCLKMLANNIVANVKGKDLGQNLLNLVERLKPMNITYLFLKLDAELEKICKDLEKRKVKNIETNSRVVSFKDKIECLKAFAENSSTLAELKRKIAYVFSDESQKNSINLCTVHKSKGLEAENVFIILPSKLPLTWKDQKEWEAQQELNLKYVAITRAKKSLTWVDLDESELANYNFKS